ncbi:hypothetical protein [Cellulomonas endophytica]|uniref:hypothetical protein n=1 Tax=Cellulomonas endophytica TaxID=2494735 RepID=UPI001012019F|nr:hypothetical protein [Cellulomonas endophytica]
MLEIVERPAPRRMRAAAGVPPRRPRRTPAPDEPLLRSADGLAVALAVLPVSLVLTAASLAPW